MSIAMTSMITADEFVLYTGTRKISPEISWLKAVVILFFHDCNNHNDHSLHLPVALSGWSDDIASFWLQNPIYILETTFSHQMLLSDLKKLIELIE